MQLKALVIALQGVGFGPFATALQGLSGDPQTQGAALLANRRFMVNMGSMLSMGGM